MGGKGTYITPRLRLERMTSFSLLFICRAQIKSHGKPAKKKSTITQRTTVISRRPRHQATEHLLQRVIDTGVESTVHFPGVRRSQRCFGGVHCSQKTKQVETDAPARAAIHIQIAILCHVSFTIRSKKSPSDHLATAMPTTANVCPIASNRMAEGKSSGSWTTISKTFCPKP